VVLELDVHFEDYVLLVAYQNETVSFLRAEMNSLCDVRIVIVALFPKAKLCFAFDKIRQNMDLPVCKIFEKDSLRTVACYIEVMFRP